MIEEFELKEGSDYSELVGPHRIVTLELVQSKVPKDKNGGNSGYREKINPSSEEVMTRDGEPIYWKTEVVPEGSDLQDTLITHDRADAAPDPASAEFEGAGAEKSGEKKK